MYISNGNPLQFPLRALAETTPMAATSYWYNQDGMPLVDRWATYSMIYRKQPIVASIIDKKAKYTARLTPLQVIDQTNPDKPTVADPRKNAYAKLVAQPCSYLSSYAFWDWVSHTYGIYGEVYALKVRNPVGVVTDIMPMHPTRTWIKRIGGGQHGEGEVVAGTFYPIGETIYTFTLGVAASGLITVPRNEIIQMQKYNPETTMRGLSPLEALTRTTQNEDAIRTAMSSTWQRGAMPSLVVTSPGNPGTGMAKRIREKIEESHAGPSKAGGVMYMPGGMEVQEFQITPDKMQLIESLKLTREEACVRLDFPPPALHILENANFASISEQLRSVYRDVMIPDFEEIEAALDFDLRPEFYPEATFRAKFNLDEVLRGDFESRVDAAVKLGTNGSATPNEQRTLVGLPLSSDPAADKLYANQALQPLGTPVASAAPTTVNVHQPHSPVDAGDGSDPKVPKTLTASQDLQVRSILGKVGRSIKAGKMQSLRHQLAEENKAVLSSTLQQQRDAVKAHVSRGTKDVTSGVAGVMNTFAPHLTDAFVPAMTATAKAGGSLVAKKLGGKYDVGSMQNYIAATAASYADSMNGANAEELQQHLENMGESEDPADVVDNFYDTNADSRSDLFVSSLTTLFLAKAGFEAADHHGATEKTWQFEAGSKGSRSDHASMNGETVPLHEPFSNGLMVPGDSSGSAADNAGCLCLCDFS